MAYRIPKTRPGERATERSGTLAGGGAEGGKPAETGPGGAVSGATMSERDLGCRVELGREGVGGAGGTCGYPDEDRARSSEGLASSSERPGRPALGADGPVPGSARSSGKSRVPAAEATGSEDDLGELDAFLAEVQQASATGRERTLVIGAPASLVNAAETEDLLQLRSKFVQRVLAHEVLCEAGRDTKVKAEYIMPIPGWRAGRDGLGAERVEVNFLHVEFEEAWMPEVLLKLYGTHGQTHGLMGGLAVEWGEGVHIVRLAMEGEAVRVMKGSAGVDGDVELTLHPVWRAAVSGEKTTGLCVTRSDLLQKFGQHAVARITEKFRQWKVDAKLHFVALRPVLARGCGVIRGAMLVVEVEKAPWVLPKGVALKDGMPVARLEWQVVGTKRWGWDVNQVQQPLG